MNRISNTFKTAFALTCALTGTTVSTAHALPEACGDQLVMDYYETDADDFGDNEFGGSYSISAGLFEVGSALLVTPCTMWMSVDSSPDVFGNKDDQLARLEAQIESIAAATSGANALKAAANADATIFGYTKDVAEVSAKLDSGAATAYVEVMGETIIDVDAMNRPLNFIAAQTLYGRSADIDLSIFTVEVGAELAGLLGVSGNARASGGGVSAQMTPFAALNLTAEAGVDLEIASVGISGSMDFVAISIPTTATIDADEWTLQSDAEVTALSGSLEVYGSLLGESASETICEFDGFDLFNTELINESGTL